MKKLPSWEWYFGISFFTKSIRGLPFLISSQTPLPMQGVHIWSVVQGADLTLKSFFKMLLLWPTILFWVSWNERVNKPPTDVLINSPHIGEANDILNKKHVSKLYLLAVLLTKEPITLIWWIGEDSHFHKTQNYGLVSNENQNVI